MNESILITGANIGLGKETARQLALKKETKKVILFCRNQARAEAAKKDLEEKTGEKIFEIIIGDVTDANSVRTAVEEIKEPIDAVVLNAGGVVGKTAAKFTPSGMNQLAATNILGNVILVEELIKRDKLRKTVLSVSAEAVPGVKMLGVKPVSMRTSSVDEFAAVLDGSYFGKKFNALQAYAYVKYAETMWTLSMARKYPKLKFTAIPRILRKKCWVDASALPQGGDEKENNQPNTISVEHFASDLQFYSRARGFQNRPDNRGRGQVANLQTLESRRQPGLCATDP